VRGEKRSSAIINPGLDDKAKRNGGAIIEMHALNMKGTKMEKERETKRMH